MADSRYDLVLPYGDHKDDGIVQVSFTLPVAAGPLGDEAARQAMRLMALQEPQVVESAPWVKIALFLWATGN